MVTLHEYVSVLELAEYAYNTGLSTNDPSMQLSLHHTLRSGNGIESERPRMRKQLLAVRNAARNDFVREKSYSDLKLTFGEPLAPNPYLARRDQGPSLCPSCLLAWCFYPWCNQNIAHFAHAQQHTEISFFLVVFHHWSDPLRDERLARACNI